MAIHSASPMMSDAASLFPCSSSKCSVSGDSLPGSNGEIPGTDALSGYTLLHELELYVRAGIPAPQVLRMATLTSAQVVGADHERGVIAPAKWADLILVDGDPAVHITDLQEIAVVIKGGHVYDPGQIEKSLGIAPRP